jgi:hypothetical protein
MTMIYLGAAVLGGAVLLIQLLLALIGHGADVHADFDGDAALGHDIGEHGALSVRAVVAFITFFGVAGMAASKAGLGPIVTLLIAVAAGGLAFWLAGLAMLELNRLRSSGTLDIQNAVGVEARVYLTVPAERTGTGAVTVPIQGRTAKYRAVTAGPEIRTGRQCRVVAVRGGDTLEVETL